MRVVARIISIMSVLLVFSSAGRAQDWVPGERMRAATKTLALRVNKILGTSETYGLNHNFSIFGGFIAEKSQCGATLYFESGKEYMIVAGGDVFAEDVDLEIVDPEGKVLGRDTDASQTAVLQFSPPKSGRYSVSTKLYAGKSGAFVSMAIYVTGGYKVPSKNISTAIDSLMDFATSCNEIAEKNNWDCFFHTPPGYWSLFGGIVKPETTATSSGLDYPPGLYSVIATGDTVIRDLDLRISEAGKTVGEDVDVSKIASVSFERKKSSKLQIDLINADSNGPSLVILAQLALIPKETK